jgi:hypothetical protein
MYRVLLFIVLGATVLFRSAWALPTQRSLEDLREQISHQVAVDGYIERVLKIPANVPTHAEVRAFMLDLLSDDRFIKPALESFQDHPSASEQELTSNWYRHIETVASQGLLLLDDNELAVYASTVVELFHQIDTASCARFILNGDVSIVGSGFYRLSEERLNGYLPVEKKALFAGARESAPLPATPSAEMQAAIIELLAQLFETASQRYIIT